MPLADVQLNSTIGTRRSGYYRHAGPVCDNGWSYLVVLVGGHRYELCLGETERAQRARRRHLDDVTRTDHVKTRLILVHRVEDRLRDKLYAQLGRSTTIASRESTRSTAKLKAMLTSK